MMGGICFELCDWQRSREGVAYAELDAVTGFWLQRFFARHALRTMTHDQLTVLAEQTVAATKRTLPARLRPLADAVPVVYHAWPSKKILGDEFEPDILGMFAGSPHGFDSGDNNALPAHIMLFVENLWDYAEGDVETFHDEVKLTYLHELGHYFGWDEDELEARGLA
jgi:predicted Zn-dependent protease with MMP-like domain